MVLPGTGSDFNAVANAGISDNTVQTTYDLFFRKALHSSTTMRNFVTVRPQDVPHRGTPVVMQKYNWFSDSVVDGWKTPVAETSEVGLTKLPATSTFTLTPAEYAGATQTTEYLARRALVSFDGHLAASMFKAATEVIDEVIQDKIKAGVTEIIIDGGTEAALTFEDPLTGDFLREQFTRFEENNVPKWSGEFYAAAVHPRIIHDLRSEAGPNNWRVAKEYQNEGLLKLGGEIGEFEGFRFVSNNRVRQGEGSATGSPAGGQAATYNSYFFGMDGLAEAEWLPLTMVESPQVDLARRFGGIAWKFDADWGVYEPLAVDVAISSSTLG